MKNLSTRTIYDGLASDTGFVTASSEDGIKLGYIASVDVRKQGWCKIRVPEQESDVRYGKKDRANRKLEIVLHCRVQAKDFLGSRITPALTVASKRFEFVKLSSDIMGGTTIRRLANPNAMNASVQRIVIQTAE